MGQEIPQSERRNSASQASETSHTAADYISSQLQLEADAREALPYQFDTCTYSLGALRQTVFSCLTCSPPPSDPNAPYKPAGVCYSCSISCHGEHELVELFTRRNFTCDCGTTRLPAASRCSLRVNVQTGMKGDVHSETPSTTNAYNHNFRNRFCGCSELYDPHTEKGTMYQCLGLGSTDQGGCGEDWWHPECIFGLSRDWYKHLKQDTLDVKKDTEAADANYSDTKMQRVTNGTEMEPSLHLQSIAEEGELLVNTEVKREQNGDHPVPPGFPNEDDFEHLMCYKCIEAFPWIKPYATAPAFTFTTARDLLEADGADTKAGTTENTVAPLPHENGGKGTVLSLKRKAGDEDADDSAPALKKSKSEDDLEDRKDPVSSCKYTTLPPPPAGCVSLFLRDDFRDHICHCAKCFPLLTPHPQLLDEEAVYEPPVSDSGSDADNDGGSIGSRSLFDRGEAALSNVDRVRAIEGVMAYNKLRDNLKGFLKPFAESGQAVGAEDIKRHFEKLRGDDEAIRQAAREGADRGGGQ